MNRLGLTFLTVAWVLMAAAGACHKGKSAGGSSGGSSAGSSGSSSSSSGTGGGGGGSSGSYDAGLTGDAAAPADGSPAIDARAGDVPSKAGNTPRDAGKDATGGRIGSSATNSKADAGPLGPCTVDISASDNANLTELVAGDSRIQRVTGKIIWGTTIAETPNWQWTVTGPDGTLLKITPEPLPYADSAMIRFPLLSPGKYSISVAVTPTCRNSTVAKAEGQWPQQYFLRVLPPPSSTGNTGQRCGSGSARWCPSEDAVPFESVVRLTDMTDRSMVVALPKGTPVTIDPYWAPNPDVFPAVAIPSTIHIAPVSANSSYSLSAYNSTWTIDGVSGQRPFLAMLSDAFRYDILVVPEASPGRAPEQIVFPPFRLGKLEPNSIVPDLFRISRGMTVMGTVRVDGRPLAGARVLLRAAGDTNVAALPLLSTWGVSDETGAYSLSAKKDGVADFSMIVIPPEGTILPRVTVSSALKLIDVENDAVIPNVDFTWNSLATTRLAITVMLPDGRTPAPMARVRLQKLDPPQTPDNPPPPVGTILVDGTPPPFAVPTGELRLEGTTNKTGEVTFDAIPMAPYHIILLPPDNSSDAAVTVTDLDLTEANNDERRVYQLLRKVTLTGTILPAKQSSGARLVAMDAGDDVLGNTISATIDDEGRYTLMADPERTFRFTVEPAPGKPLPTRVLMYGVGAPSQNADLADRKLPVGLKASGTVEFFESKTSKGVSGAIVQLYCQQTGMAGCMDPKSATAVLPPPVVETTTQTDGSYTFYLPDPSSPP